MVVDTAELDDLKLSIRSNGLRLPIEVIAIEDGSCGLISGWHGPPSWRRFNRKIPRTLAPFTLLCALLGPEQRSDVLCQRQSSWRSAAP